MAYPRSSLTATATSVTSGSGVQEPAISVRSLWKVFGKDADRAMAPECNELDKDRILEEFGCVVALKDVMFDVAEGETFVVMGLSGSGKSTLVRCLVRLIEPTAGELYIRGDDILKYDEKKLTQLRRNKVAMVFQHYGLLPHRSVIDNAAWGLEVRGMDRSSRYSRTREALDLVGLSGWEQAFPRELSGGMRQRVGLARALVVDPDILLMDEPFSGLDPLIRRDMQDELLRLQHELNKTIVFITHDLNEALKIGDRIAIMRDGVIVQIGTPEEIVTKPENEYVGEFIKDIRRESILTAASVMVAPQAVASSDQIPQDVLSMLEEQDCSAAFMIDTSDRFLGIVTPEKIELALEAGVIDINDCLENEPAPVRVDTSFDDLIAPSMLTDLPIPVVDDDGKLVGEVHRRAVAEAMAAANS